MIDESDRESFPEYGEDKNWSGPTEGMHSQ